MKKTQVLWVALSCLFLQEVHAFQPFVVENIKIQGLRSLSNDAALESARIQKNKMLTQDEADALMHRLFKTGFFEDVVLSQSGNTLLIQLKERPIITELSIKGIKDKTKVDEILKEADISQGRMFDKTKLMRAERLIEHHYLSKGRYNVRVEEQIEEDKAHNKKITINIYEGDAAKIKQIKIINAHVFPEKVLLKQLLLKKTGLSSWLNKNDQYVREKLQADLETLRSYYLDRGYVDFQIESQQVSLSVDKKSVFITINVQEGEQYHLGKISFTGYKLSPEEHNLIHKKIKSGDIYSHRRLLEVREELESILGSYGYAQAEARPITEQNALTRQVDIRFHLVPHQRMYVRRINISGNATTQDEVLRRELPQLEGTWINTQLVKEGKEQLIKRGFASEVEVEHRAVATHADQVDLDYMIEEAKMREFKAELGWSAQEKLVFRLGLAQQNFLGTGKTIDFNFDNTRAYTNYSLGFLDPYFTRDGIGFGANAYYNKTDLGKATDVSDFTTDTLGTNLNWVLPLSLKESLRFGTGYDHIHLKLNGNHAYEILDFVNRYGQRFVEYSLTGGWAYDSLDQPMMPQKGLSHSLNMRATLPGSKLSYYRINHDVRWFRPISRGYIFNFMSQLGFGDGYGHTKQLPFFRNFYAGGIGTVRGFRENTLGPKDSKGMPFGGNAMMSATFALITPTPFVPESKTVRTSVFFDMGQVYDTRFKILKTPSGEIHRNPKGLRYSVGLSFNWQTPFGAPLVVSLSKPVKLYPGDKKKTIAFTLGSQF